MAHPFENLGLPDPDALRDHFPILVNLARASVCGYQQDPVPDRTHLGWGKDGDPLCGLEFGDGGRSSVPPIGCMAILAIDCTDCVAKGKEIFNSPEASEERRKLRSLRRHIEGVNSSVEYIERRV